jgi:hypothetical protein
VGFAWWIVVVLNVGAIKSQTDTQQILEVVMFEQKIPIWIVSFGVETSADLYF